MADQTPLKITPLPACACRRPLRDGEHTEVHCRVTATWGDLTAPYAAPAPASTPPPGDEMAEHFLDANERMGEALVEIGMALGLPKPSAAARWGAPEILARIRESGSAATPAAARPGDRLVDGGIPGTLIRCDKCSGDGLLHLPDPGATDHLRVAPQDDPGAAPAADAATATIALCDLIHNALTAAGHDCPEDGCAVFCYDLAAALIAAGVAPPGAGDTTPAATPDGERAPTYRHTRPRRRGQLADPAEDLATVERLIAECPPDYPGLPLFRRRRDELAAAVSPDGGPPALGEECGWSDDGKHAPGDGRDRGECRYCDGSPPSGAALADSGDTATTPTDEAREQRLQHLATLAPGWDSYGGLPPAAKALERAREILALLDDEPRIYPIPDGGVQLAWSHERFEVEVRPDGGVRVTIDDVELLPEGSAPTGDTTPGGARRSGHPHRLGGGCTGVVRDRGHGHGGRRLVRAPVAAGAVSAVGGAAQRGGRYRPDRGGLTWQFVTRSASE